MGTWIFRIVSFASAERHRGCSGALETKRRRDRVLDGHGGGRLDLSLILLEGLASTEHSSCDHARSASRRCVGEELGMCSAYYLGRAPKENPWTDRE